MPDMESGFSRELFQAWCTSPKNCVIVTSRTGAGTLAQDLVKNGTNRDMDMIVRKRVKLTGVELEEFRYINLKHKAIFCPICFLVEPGNEMYGHYFCPICTSGGL